MFISKHPKKNNYVPFFPLICSSLLLGCGGGSSNNDIPSSSSQPPLQNSNASYTTVSGTAFADKNLHKAKVTASCQDNVGFRNPITVNEKGIWQGEIESNKFPCRFVVTDGENYFHSYLAKSGHVNINPLTDLIIALTSSQSPKLWYSSLKDVPENQLQSSQEKILKILIEKEYKLYANSNLMTMPIQHNDQTHQIIQQLLGAIQESKVIKDYDALASLVASGNINQIPENQKLSSDNLSPLVVENISACQTRPHTPTYFDHCSANAISDFEDDQFTNLENGKNCKIKKEKDRLTLTVGETTFSTYLNQEEGDWLMGESDSWNLAVTENDNLTNQSSIALSWDKKAGGWINMIYAGSPSQQSFVCTSNRR